MLNFMSPLIAALWCRTFLTAPPNMHWKPSDKKSFCFAIKTKASAFGGWMGGKRGYPFLGDIKLLLSSSGSFQLRHSFKMNWEQGKQCDYQVIGREKKKGGARGVK